MRSVQNVKHYTSGEHYLCKYLCNVTLNAFSRPLFPNRILFYFFVPLLFSLSPSSSIIVSFLTSKMTQTQHCVLYQVPILMHIDFFSFVLIYKSCFIISDHEQKQRNL